VNAPFEFGLWVSVLPLLVVLATITWLLSMALRNVGLSEPLWPLMLFVAGVTLALHADPRAPRLSLVLWPLAAWAIRLAIHLTKRFAGKEEARRHRESRDRHGPHFGLKSFYVVFLRQALLCWVVALPLQGAFASNRPLGALDWLGALLCCLGLVFETVSDWQLARFRAGPGGDAAVLDRGFWRYTRHPNYFGECCVWWGFYLMALSAGAWWAVPGPLLLTWLLLRVPGGPLLERGIGNRRPQYADYVLKTNVFFPARPRK